MTGNVDVFGLPPEEAVRWFRQKGYTLTTDWRDVWGAAHAQAFSVARVAQLDLLATIRQHVDTAIADGRTLAEFTRDLRPQLQAAGWWGEREVTDPETGEVTIEQTGSPRRLRTIYETNLRQAHAAGRWEQMQRVAARRPFLRYVAILDGRERPEHKAWHGIVLPFDHDFWKTHAPPNGWGCRCRLQQLSQRDLERYGYSVSDDPVVRTREVENRYTGQTMRVPVGVDPGFDYNPGAVQRGYVPPPAQSAPVLTPVQTFRDYNRPPSKSITTREQAPELWPRVHGPADEAATRERFRELFGIQRGETATLTDPTGVQVLVSEQTLLDHLLEKAPHTAGTRGVPVDAARTSFIPLVRPTLEQPYEIWLVPFRTGDGRVVMRQRYIGVYENTDHIVVANRTDEGYLAWTAFTRRDLDRQREGYLLWPR